MGYKEILAWIGYTATCSKCKHREYHRGRFLSDMLLTISFVVIAYLYMTEERPYIEFRQNCSYYCREQQMSKPLLVINHTNSSNNIKIVKKIGTGPAVIQDPFV